MATKSRKDNKGRVLRKGETQRSCDGKYVYTYTDPNGKRRSIYSKDITELRKREEELIKEQLAGLDTYTACSMTVNSAFDRYISTKSELRGTTMRNYKYLYDHFVRNGFGKKKIGSVKYSDVQLFYLHLLKDRGVQIGTLCNTIHVFLHPTFQLAVRDAIIRINPSDGVIAQIKKMYGKSPNVRHALTLEQQRAFINYVENTPRYSCWSSLFKFLLGTGCRIGEAIAIRWQDVDFEKRLISINHSLVYYRRKDHSKYSFYVSLPKTEAGIRTIPLMDVVYDALKTELSNQQEYGFNETEIDGMKGFIFMNRHGNVHIPAVVNQIIKRITESYNAEEIVMAAEQRREPLIIPHFSCHHLRHTFCTRFCENETNLKVIQSIMGHANISITMDIYAEVTEAKKQEAMQNLAHKLDIF